MRQLRSPGFGTRSRTWFLLPYTSTTRCTPIDTGQSHKPCTSAELSQHIRPVGTEQYTCYRRQGSRHQGRRRSSSGRRGHTTAARSCLSTCHTRPDTPEWVRLQTKPSRTRTRETSHSEVWQCMAVRQQSQRTSTCGVSRIGRLAAMEAVRGSDTRYITLADEVAVHIALGFAVAQRLVHHTLGDVQAK